MGMMDAHMAEAKRWGASLVKKPARPLRNRAQSFLLSEDSHAKVMAEFGLTTLGEARDMVGKELRTRLTETVG